MSTIANVLLYALSGVFFSLCAMRIFGDASPRPAILGLAFGLLLCGFLLSTGKTPTRKGRDSE